MGKRGRVWLHLTSAPKNTSSHAEPSYMLTGVTVRLTDWEYAQSPQRYRSAPLNSENTMEVQWTAQFELKNESLLGMCSFILFKIEITIF